MAEYGILKVWDRETGIEYTEAAIELLSILTMGNREGYCQSKAKYLESGWTISTSRDVTLKEMILIYSDGKKPRISRRTNGTWQLDVMGHTRYAHRPFSSCYMYSSFHDSLEGALEEALSRIPCMDRIRYGVYGKCSHDIEYENHKIAECERMMAM